MPSARGVSWAKTRVTVVAIAAIAILSVVVYLLTGGTLLTEKVTLYIYLPDAGGLDRGSSARVNGITVGKVDGVALSGSNQPNRVVRLTLQIQRDRISDIPADSTGQIATEGAVGDQFLAITQGTAAARIRPNGEIAYRAAPELLQTLDVVQFAQRLRSVDATLTDIEQGKSDLGQFVLGTTMYDDLRRGLTQLDRDFRSATSVTATLGRLLRTDETYRQIRDPLAELDDRLARIQAGRGELGPWLRDDKQYVRLRGQAASLRKSIADLRAEPLFTSDEMYTSSVKELSALIARADQINASPLLRNSMAYDNLAGSLREIHNFVEQFRGNPRKFMRIKLF